MKAVTAAAATALIVTCGPAPASPPRAAGIPGPAESQPAHRGPDLHPRPVRLVAATLAGRIAEVESVWDRLAACESSGTWDIVNPPYYGGVQFKLSSWRWAGGEGLPSDTTREEQIDVAKTLLSLQGVGAWPVCGPRVGLTVEDAA